MLELGRYIPGVGAAMAWFACGGVIAAAPPPRTPHLPGREPAGLYYPQAVLASVDPALQAQAGRLLADANPVAGALVMLHAPTGRVLAWQEYRRDRRHTKSLITNALAPSASVFKIVTTAALLERAQIDPSERVCFSGGLHGIRREHLDPPRAPGARCRPFEQALGFSVNAIFAQLATQRLLRRDLLEIGERLGFNKSLPFALPARMGELRVPYGDLEFARTAIGAQNSSLSVLGAARLVHTVANGGYEPPLVLGAGTTEAGLVPPARLLSAATAAQLRRMLEVTVHSGTSLEAFSDERGASYLGGIRVAGKTGTLQPDRAGPLTSWFAGFAPSRAPDVVVSVLLQNGHVWRRKAKEVARDLLRVYFKDRRGVTEPELLSRHN